MTEDKTPLVNDGTTIAGIATDFSLTCPVNTRSATYHPGNSKQDI